MRFRTKVTLCVALLAGSVVVMAAVLFWGATGAQHNIDRSHRAYEEYNAYLALSGETFRLFKQIRRDLMDGAGETSFDLVRARQRLLQTLDRIEKLTRVQQVVRQADGLTDEKSRRVEALKQEIGKALAEVKQVEDLLRAGARDRAVALLSNTLEIRIDRQVGALIDAGLADQRAEVERMRAETSALTGSLGWVALAAVFGALTFAFFAVPLLLARLSKPIAALEEGTRKLAEGIFDQSIEICGSDEFAALAQHFNTMSAQLGQQREELVAAQRNLERKVASRTAELRRANEMLCQRDELRSQFFADISHELRTPITAMRGLAEVALRSRTMPEASYRNALGRVVEVSAQLTRLVNDLLLIARSDSGALGLESEDLDLQHVLRSVALDMRPLYIAEGATLRLEAPSYPMPVSGDRERLRQVFTILIDNALKHGPKGIKVRILMTVEAGCCRVAILDNGKGIAPSDLNRVFERFYRGNPAKGMKSAGSGLGLAIAKSLVQAHNGRITVISEVGRGTAFVVLLPLEVSLAQFGDDGIAAQASPPTLPERAAESLKEVS